ncbi:MAG: hypothetical protein JO057_28900 [Chloroflexi bacterium]|nr:hypothetical protein [Chloroflexota bacterium]
MAAVRDATARGAGGDAEDGRALPVSIATGRSRPGGATVWTGSLLRTRTTPRERRARARRPGDRSATQTLRRNRSRRADRRERQRVADELEAINRAGLAELLLVAQHVRLECRLRDIPISARGSATSSLVAWALGLIELCPLDYGLDAEMFVHDGRPDLPDLDLEIPSAWEPAMGGVRVAGCVLDRPLIWRRCSSACQPSLCAPFYVVTRKWRRIGRPADVAP